MQHSRPGPLRHVTLYVALPAWSMLLYWMGLQLLGGLFSSLDGGGVAFWAHVGGFLAGLLLINLFVVRDRLEEHRMQAWRPRRERW